MAKANKPVKAEGGAPPKNKKVLIITLFAILILGAGVAMGVLFLLNSHDKDDSEDGDEEVVKVEKPKGKKAGTGVPPVYVALDVFTVNLVPDEPGDQYVMQVNLSLELEDAESNKALGEQMPRIRNNLTLTLSSKKASELASKEGKEKLSEELRQEINTVLAPPAKGKKAPEGPVVSVLFTSFIIQ